MKYIVKIEIDNVLRSTELELNIQRLFSVIVNKYTLCNVEVNYTDNEIKFVTDNNSEPNKFVFDKNFKKITDENKLNHKPYLYQPKNNSTKKV